MIEGANLGSAELSAFVMSIIGEHYDRYGLGLPYSKPFISVIDIVDILAIVNQLTPSTACPTAVGSY